MEAGSGQGMIDIHCHILPGIDDGAVSLEEAVKMCRLAAEDGIKTIVATPHMFDGVHETPERETIRQKIGELMAASDGCVEIIPGGEIRYSHEIFEEAQQADSRIKINGSSYMLLEFAYQMVPHNLETTIFQMFNAGLTPVIAHPERNRRIQQQPKILATLVEHGAFIQIDAGSLTKSFGAEPYHTARRILEARLAHFIASDAHHAERRRPILSRAVAVAAEIAGEDYARALVIDNPAALIQDQAIPVQCEPDLDALLGKKKKWFVFWK
jgi:protein-tyrosine phosphatase